MSEFVAMHREARDVETYPSEPYRCANCERPREEHETLWQLRHRSYEVDDADEHGLHVVVRHREHYYLCPTCAAMQPRKPAWRRFLRSLAPDEGRLRATPPCTTNATSAPLSKRSPNSTQPDRWSCGEDPSSRATCGSRSGAGGGRLSVARAASCPRAPRAHHVDLRREA